MFIINTTGNTESTDQEKKTNLSTGKKVGIALVALLLVIYLGGAFYYCNHFFYGTKVGTNKIGGDTLSQAADKLNDVMANYQLKITTRDKQSDSIDAKSIDYTADTSSCLKKAMKQQNMFLWFLGAPAENKDIIATISYNKKKLSKAIKGLSFRQKGQRIAPQNAKVVLNDKGKFVIQPEVYGNTLIRDRLLHSIEGSLDNVSTTLTLSSNKDYRNPTVLRDNKLFKKQIEEANRYTKAAITYDFDYITERVDGTKIGKWLVFKDNGDVSLSYKKVLAYIEKLSKKYDTYSTVRNVADASGKKHKILFGDYGWKISENKETKQLIKDIRAGKVVKREPKYLFRGICRLKGNRDWKKTYILVNKSAQEMVYIKNGKVKMSSSVVTGDPTKGHSTPSGAYRIMYKARNQTLQGQGYASPVSYWMPFTTNTGFHDATWRGSFGGGIYMGSGSHGCVNMPYGNAAQLYSLIEKGTLVFVY